MSEELFTPRQWKRTVACLALGTGATFGLVLLSSWIQYYVENFDGVTQANYRFPLAVENVQMQCTLQKGMLIFHGGNGATFILEHRSPRPRESAVVSCDVKSTQAKNLRLYVLDAYPGGGYPDRIIQIVSVNEKRVLRHDIAEEPWTGWLDIPLGTVSREANLSFAVEIRAINPESEWKWGGVSLTSFLVKIEN